LPKSDDKKEDAMERRLLDKLGLEVQRYRDKDFLKAVMAVCALTAHADGEPHPLEIAEIDAAFRSIPCLRNLDRKKAEAIFAVYSEALDRGDPQARRVLYRKIQVFENQFKKARTLLRVAYLIVMADGIDHPQEVREFKRICGLLAFDPARVWAELASNRPA
jgi:tellurite resistance protein TerB